MIALRDVEYIIEVHFDMTDDAAPGDIPGKFKNIIRKRLNTKNYYTDIYFGTKEFPAETLAGINNTIESPYKGKILNLRYMLYDYDCSDPNNILPIFFQAVLKHGILDLTHPIRCLR